MFPLDLKDYKVVLNCVFPRMTTVMIHALS